MEALAQSQPVQTASQANDSVLAFVKRGAQDSAFFAETFFPQTCRQKTPAFHAQIWQLLDSTDRMINIQVFRGGAKTSICRMFTAKRIAYGISRTILYIGKSQDHAQKSLAWIKRQIERNKDFYQAFGLEKGDKWTDTEIRIEHKVLGITITVIALGITGSVRGVNIEDYRPDLIVVDDVIDEENSATPEQRDKVNKLIHGALKESLAPRSENPLAMMAMLQTPLDFEDASVEAFRNPAWTSARFSCWTPETEDLPVEKQESSWPERWSSEELRQDKMHAIASNDLSIFMREKECKLISPETASFRPEWLRFYGETQDEPEPERTTNILVIDPVPPPSDIQVAKGLHGKDYEAISVVGFKGGKYYLRESVYNRGHDPSWTVATVFSLAHRYAVQRIVVEAVAYQRTLSWLLREQMKRDGRYYVVEEFVDRRKKIDRIVDALKPVVTNGALYVKTEHREFISQFTHYPNVKHDDVIETVAIGVASFVTHSVDIDFDDYVVIEDNIKALEYPRGAP